jgi:hypothetical protein
MCTWHAIVMACAEWVRARGEPMPDWIVHDLLAIARGEHA